VLREEPGEYSEITRLLTEYGSPGAFFHPIARIAMGRYWLLTWTCYGVAEVQNRMGRRRDRAEVKIDRAKQDAADPFARGV